MALAGRRVSSSLCAFGGSLPPRTVSPSPSFGAPQVTSSSSPNEPNIPSKAPATKEESAAEKSERIQYEEQLSSRYFMKEGCISWDVELHEVIAPKAGAKVPGRGPKGKGNSTPKGGARKQIGVFKIDGGAPPLKYCAPVTPHTPRAPGGSSAPQPPPPPPTPTGGLEKGSGKIKYRCKLCGQPKQNHTCSSAPP